MSTSRAGVMLIVIVITLLLTKLIAGNADPAPERGQKARASFESLQKKLPGLIADWAKKADWLEPKQVKTEIKLARFTGPSEAKVTLFTQLKFESPVIDSPDFERSLQLSFYLRYFDGRWTTTAVDCW
jgi:hypothetical protein